MEEEGEERGGEGRGGEGRGGGDGMDIGNGGVCGSACRMRPGGRDSKGCEQCVMETKNW